MPEIVVQMFEVEVPPHEVWAYCKACGWDEWHCEAENFEAAQALAQAHVETRHGMKLAVAPSHVNRTQYLPPSKANLNTRRGILNLKLKL